MTIYDQCYRGHPIDPPVTDADDAEPRWPCGCPVRISDTDAISDIDHAIATLASERMHCSTHERHELITSRINELLDVRQSRVTR